jgi:hypothetical protein
MDRVAASDTDPAARLFVAMGQIIRGDGERARSWDIGRPEVRAGVAAAVPAPCYAALSYVGSGEA